MFSERWVGHELYVLPSEPSLMMTFGRSRYDMLDRPAYTTGLEDLQRQKERRPLSFVNVRLPSHLTHPPIADRLWRPDVTG